MYYFSSFIDTFFINIDANGNKISAFIKESSDD